MAGKDMTGGAPPVIAHRLVAAATAVMPASRRAWGKAISAELDYARSRGDRIGLVLSAARVALLPPPGVFGRLREYASAARRAAILAGVAFVPLGAGLYVSNVVIRPAHDSAAGALAMGGYQLLICLAAGALARWASPRIAAAITAGIAAGVVLGVLEMATFAWLDNVFFSAISQQQEKIDSFRGSGMTSMRAYLNADLKATTLGVILSLAGMGAVFAPIGAALSAHAAEARSHLRRLI